MVELLHFEEIYINFLIVGHTHNILDQYFSVLSKAIGACSWIGSPLSLVNLFDICHSSPREKPGLQRELRVIYDVERAWAPFLNSNIKYYNVPHCFKFSLKFGFGIMQWKHLSTDKEWKPKPPSLEAEIKESLDLPITAMEYGIASDVDNLYTLIGVQSNSSSSAMVRAAQDKGLAAVARVTPILHNLSLCAAQQQSSRLTAQESLGQYGTMPRFTTSEAELVQFQKYVKAHSDDKEGCIMWVSHAAAASSECGELTSVIPSVIGFQDAIDYVSNMEGSAGSKVHKKASQIALVCSRVINQVEGGFIERDVEEFSYYQNNTSENVRALTSMEMDYYYSRSTAMCVLENFIRSIESETASSPYEFFPVRHLSQQLQEELATENEARRKKINEQLAQLNKSRYRNFESVHFDREQSRGSGRRGRAARGGAARGGAAPPAAGDGARGRGGGGRGGRAARGSGAGGRGGGGCAAGAGAGGRDEGTGAGHTDEEGERQVLLLQTVVQRDQLLREQVAKDFAANEQLLRDQLLKEAAEKEDLKKQLAAIREKEVHRGTVVRQEA